MELKIGKAALVVALTIIFAALPVSFIWNPEPVQAQSVGFCDQSAAISIASGSTQTIATAIPGAAVYVCGFTLTADTIATTGQFKTGSTNLSGAMRLCDECQVTYGNGVGLIMTAPQGGNLTLTAATGAITGIVTFGQR